MPLKDNVKVAFGRTDNVRGNYVEEDGLKDSIAMKFRRNRIHQVFQQFFK